MGKTKVFIKNPTTVFMLEEERDEKLDQIVSRLQLAWRLFLIRREIRTYYETLAERFKNVANDPSWGAKVEWPSHGPILNDAEKMLRKTFKNWWARKMVTSLTPEQQEIMRVQLLAHRFLSDKEGFAISRSQFTIHHFDNEGARKSFESSNGESLFDAPVVKVSRSGKPMPRVVVLTKTSLYRLDPGLKVNPKRPLT